MDLGDKFIVTILTILTFVVLIICGMFLADSYMNYKEYGRFEVKKHDILKCRNL